MWLFLQAVVSISRGTIETESAFCQASGFLVQFGTETSGQSCRPLCYIACLCYRADYAVLCIAVHSALQVFRPSNTIHSNGLYPYRYHICVGAFIFPTIMAALAFINPRWGYMLQGPYCSLPLRPFWYRIALQWIPRYVITIIILGLAIAIYAHVGFEFRALRHSATGTKPSVATTNTLLSEGTPEGSASMPEMADYRVDQFQRGSSVISRPVPTRRVSDRVSVASQIAFANDNVRADSVPGNPYPVDRCEMPPPLLTYDNPNTANGSSFNIVNEDGSHANHDSDGNASPFTEATSQELQRQMAQKRARIHRQLRLMFIYPIVYLLVWIIPFINHCMTYQDWFARRPIWWLVLLNVICITSMGAVDCLIFSIRECPWRHIPDSDGTFLGSFVWWHKYSDSNGDPLPPHQRPSDSLQSTVCEGKPDTPHRQLQHLYKEWKGGVIGRNVGGHSRNSGSSSDYARTQAVLARTRLELEKEDRRMASTSSMVDESVRSPKGRRGTALTDLESVESPQEEPKQEESMRRSEVIAAGQEHVREPSECSRYS